MTHTTTPRADFAATAPKAFKALIAFDTAARQGLDPALVELIQIRASQLNNCTYCLTIHLNHAHNAGEDNLRLHMIAHWRQATHYFTPKEQAALALTEAITLISTHGVPDEMYAQARAEFNDDELTHILAVTCSINTYNRITITTTKTNRPPTDTGTHQHH
ncbi:carboxymuconolactone decarboxylase family protein [Streptomyces sp. P9(2023)]|uniref:carboxymuconolactone decarboxylase family protein n=1 Tax=Streptomyces sp. P9(2023) TaxID=3064394 RepID=UPI0037DC10B8